MGIEPGNDRPPFCREEKEQMKEEFNLGCTGNRILVFREAAGDVSKTLLSYYYKELFFSADFHRLGFNLV